MEPEGKKISFGFSKLTKKSNFAPKPPARLEKIQLIDCLESHTIKLKNVVEKTKGPLIIPLPESSGNILDRRRELKLKRETKSEEIDVRLDSELTPDELAARELIRDAQNLNGKSETGKLYALPIATENSITIEGKEESTIENYESVPITEYGIAMLRGMGWKEGVAIGKNTKNVVTVKEPTLRPRGLGLGANKSTNRDDTQKSVDKDGKELVLKKGGYAKIIDGKQKGNFCEVQGFDDAETGRIIVRTALQGLILSINELFVRPVSNEEYAKSSKVINYAKYEEYKSKTEFKEEMKSVRHLESTDKKESNVTSDQSNSRHRRSSSEDSDSRRKSRQRTSKNDENDRHKYKKKSKKKHRPSSCSSVESDKDRRQHRERTRRSSLSDHEYKKYRSKSKKKSKDKKSYKYRSDSDSDYSYKRNKDSHKKHQGRKT